MPGAGSTSLSHHPVRVTGLRPVGIHRHPGVLPQLRALRCGVMTIVGGSGVRLRRRKPHRLIGEGTVTAPQGVSRGRKPPNKINGIGRRTPTAAGNRITHQAA